MSQPREMCSARAASSFSSAAKCSGVLPSVIEAPGTGFRNESLRANAEVLRRSDALRLSGALRLLRDALRLSDSVIAAGVSGISSCLALPTTAPTVGVQTRCASGFYKLAPKVPH
eukprot:scaffold39963_cov54-Phaeocystis_antarctica.AAC.2